MGFFDIGTLEALGILLMAGYFGGRLANRLRFPRVSGYIIAGILLSPSVTEILPSLMIQGKLHIINDMALAVIAYAVGGSLKFSKLRRLGKTIFAINLSEALGSFFLTLAVIFALSPWLIGQDPAFRPWTAVNFSMALVIAAVSAATAPAAILAIIHEYKAKGPLTTTLLGVVALDDAVAIILFALSSTIVHTFAASDGFSVYKLAAEPVITIFGAMVLGIVVGFCLTGLTPRIKTKESLLVVILGGIFLCSGLAGHFNLSALLANMTVGFIIVNTAAHSDRLFRTIEDIEEPIFALFFTLAGAHFDWTVFKQVGMLAVLIVACRFTGKFIGTRMGARLSHAPDMVRKYLGYGLLPTAGVSLGLIFMARPLFQPAVFDLMVNAVLGAVIISEIIAPPLVRFALKRAGEGAKE